MTEPTPTTAAAVAQLFHEAYERLAPSFGYQTRRESAVPWDDVPEQNKALMTAVAAEVIPVLLAAPDGPWHAYLTDLYGHILGIEDLPHGALANGGRIVICRDSALPDGEFMPGTWTTSDLFLELDFDDYETVEEATEAWHQAVAAAEGMNRAIARGEAGS